VSDLVIAIIA